MHFTVKKEWEVKNPILAALGEPGTGWYQLIELPLNIKVFMVDALIEHHDHQAWHRYMVPSIANALDLITRTYVKSHKLAIMSRRDDNSGEYSIADIEEVITAKTHAKQHCYIFSCVDGKRYYEHANASLENDLTEKQTIYRRKTNVLQFTLPESS